MDPMNRLAILVPMAVPHSYRKKSPLNIVFSTTLSISIGISTGVWRGSGSWSLLSACALALMPSLCGIFVNRDETSILTRIMSVGIVIMQLNEFHLTFDIYIMTATSV